MKLSRRNIAAFLIASSAALALPLAVQAEPSAPHGFAGCHEGMAGGHFGFGMHLPLHGLDLSEAQKDKIFDIVHAQEPALREKGKALHKAHAELRQVSLAASFDSRRAQEAADAVAKAGAEMALLQAQTTAKVVAVLTPEQRQRLQDMPQPGDRAPRGSRPDDKRN